MMAALMARYAGFHQHILLAGRDAVQFYSKIGFKRAGRTEPIWIYERHYTDCPVVESTLKQAARERFLRD